MIPCIDVIRERKNINVGTGKNKLEENRTIQKFVKAVIMKESDGGRGREEGGNSCDC